MLNFNLQQNNRQTETILFNVTVGVTLMVLRQFDGKCVRYFFPHLGDNIVHSCFVSSKSIIYVDIRVFIRTHDA